jgi:hypothetical protein
MYDVLVPWVLLSAIVTSFYKEAELISLSYSRRGLENVRLLMTLTCCVCRFTRNKEKAKQTNTEKITQSKRKVGYCFAFS